MSNSSPDGDWGESGVDLSKVKAWGPPSMAEVRPDYPFVLVSPQSPSGDEFDIEALDELARVLLDRLPGLDRERVLATGLSLGGIATWEWAIAHPGRFAGIAPIAGDAEPAHACAVKDLPTWAFHGDADDSVPIAGERTFIAALRACGGKPRYTVYEATGHVDAWRKAYADPALEKWLLAQRKRSQ